MKKTKIHKILENIPKAKTKRVLEDLQYNLTVFLNEDIYLDHFDQEEESLFWVFFFEKHGLIFITEEEERLLLTPMGQNVLHEINSLLLYID